MSRDYDVYVMIDKVPKNLLKKVMALLKDFVDDATDVNISEVITGTLEFELELGSNHLCGGEGTDEAHESLKKDLLKLDANITLVTKWHCIGNWSWDDEYGNEKEAD
jgi:hypothetical protein